MEYNYLEDSIQTFIIYTFPKIRSTPQFTEGSVECCLIESKLKLFISNLNKIDNNIRKLCGWVSCQVHCSRIYFEG